MKISLESSLKESVSRLIQAERAVERLESELKESKEVARILREETVPGIMNELGIKGMAFDDGTSVKMKFDVHARISEGDKPAAFDWLVENGLESVIKTNVVARFSKGELARAEKLSAALAAKGIDAAVDMNVHPQTLKAILRDQIESGTPVPLDIFGATCIWKAVTSL